VVWEGDERSVKKIRLRFSKGDAGFNIYHNFGESIEMIIETDEPLILVQVIPDRIETPITSKTVTERTI
jgi:hypothetical protein